MMQKATVLIIICGWFSFVGINELYAHSSAAIEDTLYVIDMQMSLDVIEREPYEVVQSYTMADERAWCFARLYNSGNLQTITFKWYYEDNEYFSMESKVGNSSNWRTYSSITLQPGVWRVELLNSNGKKLREIRFHVSE